MSAPNNFQRAPTHGPAASARRLNAITAWQLALAAENAFDALPLLLADE